MACWPQLGRIGPILRCRLTAAAEVGLLGCGAALSHACSTKTYIGQAYLKTGRAASGSLSLPLGVSFPSARLISSPVSEDEEDPAVLLQHPLPPAPAAFSLIAFFFGHSFCVLLLLLLQLGPKPPATASLRWRARLAATSRRSYSRPRRRTASIATTRKKTPITLPANWARVELCHEVLMKHESTVFQFHSMLTAHWEREMAKRAWRSGQSNRIEQDRSKVRLGVARRRRVASARRTAEHSWM